MPRSLCEQSNATAAGISLEDRPIFLAVSKSLQQGCAPVSYRQKSRSTGTGEFMLSELSPRITKAQSASLEVVVCGFGPRVVLVHGSVFNGPLTWKEQRPLGQRWRLEVLNRRGYGKSPPPEVRSDFEEDARDIAALLGDDAHLVGHSYGAIGALYAAALRPQAVRSLTINEPPAYRLIKGNAEADAIVARLQATRRDVHEPRAFLEAFRKIINGPGAPSPVPLP